MNEKLLSEQNFEQLSYETERKLVPIDATLFAPYEQLAEPIEQVYLSRPDEDYTLRVRAHQTPQGSRYTATLKDKGEMTPHGLARLEVETDIDQATYELYANSSQYPRVTKRRAALVEGVTVDWIDGFPQPLIEIENSGNNPLAAQFYTDFSANMLDVTGDRAYDNSSIAYEQFDGSFEPLAELSAADIVAELISQFQIGKSHTVVGISGMSGSGKTTLAHDVHHELVRQFGEDLPPVIQLSTDDYHRGKHYLEAAYGAPWTNWDLPEVYDTETLASHLAALKSGQPIPRQRFDFPRQEAVVTGVIEPSPIIIVEGIFAGSPDLQTVRDLHFTVPTPLATTVARDLLRLVSSDRSNSSIATPEARLRYQLETAIPTYQAQERPRRNSWASSVRTIGKVAWLSRNASAAPRP